MIAVINALVPVFLLVALGATPVHSRNARAKLFSARAPSMPKSKLREPSTTAGSAPLVTCSVQPCG